MKYIVFANDRQDRLCPILFPEHLVHAEVAKDLLSGHMRGGWRVDSAGFLSCISMECHGESESLGVKSKPERDTKLISTIDYNAGMV